MDINEILNRAKGAQAQALASLHEMEEKAETLASSSCPSRTSRSGTLPRRKRSR